MELKIEKLAREGGSLFNDTANATRPTMTRAEAMEAGHTTYYDGTVCARDHVGASRFVQTGSCCACHAMGSEQRAQDGDMRGIRRGQHPRRVAQEQGRYKYETGKPCKHGHVAPRYTATGNCTECKPTRKDSGRPDRRVKFTLRSELTGRRFRVAFADGVHVLEASHQAGQLLQIRFDSDGQPHERIVRQKRVTEWHPVTQWHPDVIAELQALLVTGIAAE